MRFALLVTCLTYCRAQGSDDLANPATQSESLDVPEPKTRAPADAASACAHAFGDELKRGFGRLDGTILAIVPPTNTTCAMPSDHLVVQVKTANKVYRVLVNLQSDRGDDAQVHMQAVEHSKLEGPAFKEGWHDKDITLDYAATFGLAPADLTPYPQDALLKEVTGWLEVGRQVSVFGSADRGHSAHLMYRTSNGKDGAIVINPTSKKPVYLVFAFAGQDF